MSSPTYGQDFQRLIAQLKRHEGTKRDSTGNHIAYRCTAGALTIGYGHNLDANPVPGINADSKLNDDQANRLLVTDIHTIQKSLEANIPWASKLDPARYAVLVNMAFNLGVGGLLGFKNTLAYIRTGDYANAAKNMLKSKWASQVGRRAVELAKQMETGVWQ